MAWFLAGLRRLAVLCGVGLAAVALVSLLIGLGVGSGLHRSLERGYLIAGVGCGILSLGAFGTPSERSGRGQGSMGIFIVLAVLFLAVGIGLDMTHHTGSHAPGV
jgi:hypothetical protein